MKRPKRGRLTRIFVRRYLGDTRAEWGCYAADHVWTGPLFSRVAQRRHIGDDGHRFMASWWSFAKGGCTGVCPKCQPATSRRRD